MPVGSETFALDTNCIIAILMVDHPHRDETIDAVEKRRKAGQKGIICANTLAEAFAVLTRLPEPARVPAQAALDALQELCTCFELVPVAPEMVLRAMDRVVHVQARGGVVYDALIAESCRRAGALTLLTWNVGDFGRVAPAGLAVQSPGQVA